MSAYKAVIVGMMLGVFVGYLIGGWHLMWANASFESENTTLRSELRIWRKGWVPRGFVLPKQPLAVAGEWVPTCPHCGNEQSEGHAGNCDNPMQRED